MFFILVFSSIYFFAHVEAQCPGGVSLCQWSPWEEWHSCSLTCGGGNQYRWRPACCKAELASDSAACYRDCGMSSSDRFDYRGCNAFCNNGGTIHYTYSKYGNCKCPPTHSGSCCDIRMCAWNDNYCWPGHCYGGYLSNCDCLSGFRKVATSNETKCQPSWSPSILKCEVNATGHNGENKQAVKTGNSIQCPYYSVMYGNFHPTSLQFDLLAVYRVHVESYPRPDFISEFKFGVTDMLISVTKHSLFGTSTTISSLNQLQDSNSSQNANETVFDNGSLSILNYSISNGESLCLKFEVRGGGYLKSKNTVTNEVSSAIPYNKVSTTKEVCYRYDNDPPIHCQASGSCKIEPLQLLHRISRSSEQVITFAGWTDPVPSGGSKMHASAIENYRIIVNQVMTLRGQPSKIDKVLFTKLVNYTESSIVINLTYDNPRLYSITLEVKDKADNVRRARRFLLVDNTSYIITTADKPFWVTTASSQTNYTWQANHQHVCLEWTDHFINEFYVDNEILNPVETEPDGHFTGVYEQLSGELPVSGTPNVNGITEFKLSWKLNDGNFSNEISVPNLLDQSYCTNLSVEDGQIYTFYLRSIDIANNTFEEERTVYIDRSAPYISNISLTEDTNETYIIYYGTDLSSTTQLYFETTDLHSGIRTITWTLNETDSGLEQLASGSLEVGTIAANSCSESTGQCYCPDVGPCELFNYTFPLNKLAIYHKEIGDRNTSYYFTVTVTNNAMLSSTERKEIIVNNYQPEPGKAHIGKESYIVGGTAGCLVFIASLALATVIILRRKRLAKQSNSKSTSCDHKDKSSGHATDIKGENTGLEQVCYDNLEYISPSTKLSEQNPCQRKNPAQLPDESQETENVYELMEDFDSKRVIKENCHMKPAIIENQGSNQVCKPTASQHSGGNTDDCGEYYENLNIYNVSSGSTRLQVQS